MRKIIILGSMLVLLSCNKIRPNNDDISQGTNLEEQTILFDDDRYGSEDILLESLRDNEIKELKQQINFLHHRNDQDETKIYIMGEINIEMAARYLMQGLEKKGFKQISDAEYSDKIKYIFGLSLDSPSSDRYFIPHSNYAVYLIDQYGDDPHIFESENDYTYDHLFFIQNNMNFITQFVFLDDIISEIGDSSITVSISNMLYHRNKYLLNDSKASLMWLINNDEDFIVNLLCVFGFDKEPKINKKVLDIKYQEYIKTEPYNVGVLDGVFVKKGYDGNLHIRDGLMKYIAESTTIESPELLNMLYDYGRYILNEDTGFTTEEKIKIAAYIGYYDQLVRRKYEIDDTIPPHVVPLGWTYGDFLRNETNTENNLIAEIKNNNYYNLPDYDEFIADVLDK